MDIAEIGMLLSSSTACLITGSCTFSPALVMLDSTVTS
ncbi:hypothetical protein MELE44368_15320 [Mycolicibacterium elephantis DSM 44368]|uniref:Uncharacterized protein n=1 Tax=Mycolicibacterium elephantis DSM 44368 TaxID=1335622 RepID=A0A439DWT8_9MYCO|nr:hypothetical protein MELE44368_15320 [Mycolicibacterium elephantis DSM 44368]